MSSATLHAQPGLRNAVRQVPDEGRPPETRRLSRATPPTGGLQTGRIDPHPGSSGFVALLEAFRPTGGMAPANFLCRSLQEHQRGDLRRLASLIVERRVFVLDWRGDSWIPMFQFDGHDLSCKLGPALVRAELADLSSGWAVAAWFAQPNRLLDGRRPVDMVESDLAVVLDAARRVAPSAKVSRGAQAHA